MSGMTEAELKAHKAATKEAITEWMDKKYNENMAKVGTWAVGVIAAAIFAALVYFTLNMGGWHK